MFSAWGENLVLWDQGGGFVRLAEKRGKLLPLRMVCQTFFSKEKGEGGGFLGYISAKEKKVDSDMRS